MQRMDQQIRHPHDVNLEDIDVYWQSQNTKQIEINNFTNQITKHFEYDCYSHQSTQSIKLNRLHQFDFNN